MRQYFVETDYGIGYGVSDVADTEEAAMELLSKRKEEPISAFLRDIRIVCEDVPDDLKERFEFAVRKLEKERIYADDEGLDDLSLHISWGDWKHEHMRADYVMGLYGFQVVNEVVDQEDGSDCYSAWHTYVPKEVQS